MVTRRLPWVHFVRHGGLYLDIFLQPGIMNFTSQRQHAVSHFGMLFDTSACDTAHAYVSLLAVIILFLVMRTSLSKLPVPTLT